MNKIYILKADTDAYGFVKQLAAEKYNIPKETLLIARNNHGKPYFAALPHFHFNISHSHGLLAITVSNNEIGIDIEKLRTPSLLVTKRFCQEEQDYIAEKDSQKRFFEVWTKKEAYLKYKGTGLSGGLKSFSVFESDIPIKTYTYGEYIISVCGEENFEIIKA